MLAAFVSGDLGVLIPLPLPSSFPNLSLKGAGAQGQREGGLGADVASKAERDSTDLEEGRQDLQLPFYWPNHDEQ